MAGAPGGILIAACIDRMMPWSQVVLMVQQVLQHMGAFLADVMDHLPVEGDAAGVLDRPDWSDEFPRSPDQVQPGLSLHQISPQYRMNIHPDFLD